MEYTKKLSQYRKVIKNENTLKFVDFLENLFDWLDKLYKDKRLRYDQEEELYIPKEIFQKLDNISPVKLSKKEFNDLKKILLEESSDFIDSVISVGKLKMHDFDLLQFNLYQIFGKEELGMCFLGIVYDIFAIDHLRVH